MRPSPLPALLVTSTLLLAACAADPDDVAPPPAAAEGVAQLQPAPDGWGEAQRRDWPTDELLAALAAETWAGAPFASRLDGALAARPVTWTWQLAADGGLEHRMLLVAPVSGDGDDPTFGETVELLSAPHEGFGDRTVTTVEVAGAHWELVTLEQRDGPLVAQWLWRQTDRWWVLATGVGTTVEDDLVELVAEADLLS